GGEKASVALAYRLALHATLNSMIATMRTKNILLLDEPTDGFSSEQLDVLKEVFAQTKATQTILVSHEQKIESFADQIIRVAKKGHESVILQ
ncbi:MAG TPA: SMC family ATPase, partial [Candidatus Nanoarchaeia archaeon]|nr:SMC family ATPase [Candidatus Nanoarchaeia archaeon]